MWDYTKAIVCRINIIIAHIYELCHRHQPRIVLSLYVLYSAKAKRGNVCVRRVAAWARVVRWLNYTYVNGQKGTRVYFNIIVPKPLYTVTSTPPYIFTLRV